MGCNLKELVVKQELTLEKLSNRVLAVDSHNLLYQFLTTIRQPDGALLTDSKGNVTSHLIGLFNRTSRLMLNNTRLIFVFDGKAPELKSEEIKKRALVKREAQRHYEIAKEREDIILMKKYASRFVTLTGDMIADAKRLINLLGLPVVQAPSEGEAQVAHIVKNGDAFAAVSQDYDTLLYGAPRLIHNLTIAGRRKRIHGKGSVIVNPELIDFRATLSHLNISHDQLIALAVLVGTDYNPGGVKGIGPKTALKLVQEYGSDFDALFVKVGFPGWKKVYDTFKQMPVLGDYNLKFGNIDLDGIKTFLVDERGFSREKVDTVLDALNKEVKKHSQKGLGDFLI